MLVRAWVVCAPVAMGAIVALAAVTGSACSLVVGWDDLGGGCREPCTEGGAASGDAANGLTDAQALDAASGAPEAGLDCSAHHDLCDDFDESAEFPNLTRWTTLEQSGSATAGLVTDDVRSAPRSFRADAEGAGEHSISLVKSLAGPLKRLTCELALKPAPSAGKTNTFPIVLVDLHPLATSSIEDYFVTFGTTAADHTIGEYWQPRGTSFDGTGYDSFAKPVAGVWQKLRFELVVGPPATMTVYYNDAPALGTVSLPKLPQDHDVVQIKLGAMPDPDQTGGKVTFDDVVCDAVR
jgi:hypothetical protein